MEFPYLLTTLLLLASYLITNRLRRRSSTLPPTVFPSLPIIGHLYLLKQPIYRTLAKLSAKHGPILRLQLGYRHALVVSSPAAVEECLNKNDIIFANRPKMLYGKIIGVNYTSLGWSPYGENWRHLRRIAAIEVLSIHRLNEFHDIRVDEARLLIRKLLSSFNSGSSQVKMKNVFYQLTLNVIMRMISGKGYFGGDNPELEEEGKRFREMLEETFVLAASSNIGDYMPAVFSWFWLNGLEKKLIKLQEKREAFFQGLIEQFRKSKGTEDANKKKTMIELLLTLQETEPEYYTDTMIRNFVLALLAAGSDTSAGTMEWVMAVLLNHPQVLKKAQNEIDNVIGNNRLVDESDIPNLPYLRSIINETLRLYPAGPLLVPHEASSDCVVGGYNIPRGTMLIVNLWAIHHDPMVWDDPEMFKPERFEGLEGTRDGFKLFPFGSGRRSCPGEALAIRMLGMALGSIIQCFGWKRTSEELADMTEGPGVTMPKAIPLVAKFKPRQEMTNLLSEL
ncbi:putative oxidoreductase [Helianthus annuus]|nr:putative oxidoreductase [Helianthus annuus]